MNLLNNNDIRMSFCSISSISNIISSLPVLWGVGPFNQVIKIQNYFPKNFITLIFFFIREIRGCLVQVHSYEKYKMFWFWSQCLQNWSPSCIFSPAVTFSVKWTGIFGLIQRIVQPLKWCSEHHKFLYLPFGHTPLVQPTAVRLHISII